MSGIEADRAAVRALVDGLPKCGQYIVGTESDDKDCEQPAVVRAYIDGDRRLRCAEHNADSDPDDVLDLPYAPALRALLGRIKGWTS